MHITNRGVSWKFANGAEDLALKALLFHYMCICRKFPRRRGVSHYRPNKRFMEGQPNVTSQPNIRESYQTAPPPPRVYWEHSQ
jgi:hypothetical protein